MMTREERDPIVPRNGHYDGRNGVNEESGESRKDINIMQHVKSCHWTNQSDGIAIRSEPQPKKVQPIYAAESARGIAVHILRCLRDERADNWRRDNHSDVNGVLIPRLPDHRCFVVRVFPHDENNDKFGDEPERDSGTTKNRSDTLTAKR